MSDFQGWCMVHRIIYTNPNEHGDRQCHDGNVTTQRNTVHVPNEHVHEAPRMVVNGTHKTLHVHVPKGIDHLVIEHEHGETIAYVPQLMST